MRTVFTLCVLTCIGSLAMAQTPRRKTAVHNANWNDSPYGMNAFHPNGPAPEGHLAHFTDRNMARLAEGNIQWVRLMIDWRYCEPQRGQYYWDALERVVKMCNDRKIGISACLYEPPAWALVGDSTWLVAPGDFERFGQAIATQFKDRIAAYEVYNERPTGTWPKVADRSAELYVPIQKAAYAGIKRGDPKAVVVMTGLWEFPLYYLEDMYKLGAKDSFDAINIHYYLRASRDPHLKDAFRGDLPTVLQQVDYVTRKYGDGGKPIWITEYGWPATAESQEFPVGEQKMAQYAQYFLETARDSGLVEKCFWYVYYLSDGMAMWHQGQDRKRPVWGMHKSFAERWPTWDGLPVKPLPYPPAAERPVDVPGGDCEDPDGWAVGPNAPVQFVEDGPHGGSKCIRMTCRGSAELAGKPFALEAGKAYELTGYIRMAGGRADPRYAHAMIHLELLGEGNRTLGLLGPCKGELADDRSANYYISDTGGQWYEVHYFVFPPPQARGGRIVLKMGHPDAPNGQADFDDIRLTPVDLGRPPTVAGSE